MRMLQLNRLFQSLLFHKKAFHNIDCDRVFFGGEMVCCMYYSGLLLLLASYAVVTRDLTPFSEGDAIG